MVVANSVAKLNTIFNFVYIYPNDTLNTHMVIWGISCYNEVKIIAIGKWIIRVVGSNIIMAAEECVGVERLSGVLFVV